MSTQPALNATETAERLRAWAAGSHPLVAAVELLVGAFDGRFAQPGQPWIRIEANGYVWLDDEVLHASLGPLSSGERRVLDVVCALAEPSRTLHLADALVGLDRRHLDLVLAACAHASGSHEHAELGTDPATGEMRVRHLGSAHPWPTAPRPDATLPPTSPPDSTI